VTEISALLRDAVTRLARAGVLSPDADAIALAAFTLGWEPGQVRTAAARGDKWPEVSELDRWESRLMRRIDREPLQHITGVAHFRGLDLEVGPGVFIPRPETEMVAQAAIDAALAAKPGRDGLVHVTDLCAGSGAIGLAIASEVPHAHVSVVEASDEATVYLRRNVRALADDVRDRVRVIFGDARSCLRHFDTCADVVVTNPPYIPTAAIPRDAEVALHDPPEALYGLGDDGLQIPRAIIDESARLLRVGGTLIMEHGEEQGPALREYAASLEWWDHVETRRDLTGRDRMLVARRVGV
jgi:release factor glutamine methyltransferase